MTSTKVTEEQKKAEEQWGKGVSLKMMKKARKYKYEEEEE